MIELILLLVIIFGLGFQAGMIAHKKMMIQLVEKIATEVEEEEESNLLKVYLEEHDDQIFAYREEDKTYLAHSTNSDDLVQKLKVRFPDKTLAANQDSVGLLFKFNKNDTI